MRFARASAINLIESDTLQDRTFAASEVTNSIVEFLSFAQNVTDRAGFTILIVNYQGKRTITGLRYP